MHAPLRAVAALLLAPVALSAPPAGTDAAVLPAGVRADVQVTAMDLDVVATRNGADVTDLRRDEVRVAVDGKPVTPDFFSRVEEGTLHGPDLAAAPPELILETQKDAQGQRFVPRQFLVVFDDQHLLPQDRPRFIEGLRDFVTRLYPTDRMAIISIASSSRTLVPFTGSKESLLDGLTRIASIAPPGQSWDAQFRQQVHEIERTAPRGRQPLVRSWAEQVRVREEGTLEELRRAVSALAARPGKRILLYVSRGFELHPGQSLFAAIGAGGTLNQFDYSVREPWQKVIDEANRSGITIHAFDGRGLVPDSDASESSAPFVSTFFANENRRETLGGFAEQTGGTLVFERNLFQPDLERIYRESASYYIVGVTLSSLDPKKGAHDVKVTTTRPGVTLRTRRRYAPMTADEAARNRTEMALITPDAQGDFPVSLQMGAAAKGGGIGRRLSPFVVRFPLSSLTITEEAGVRKGTVDVTIAAVEDSGARSGVAPTRVPIAIPDAEWERARSEGFAYAGELKSRTGNFRFVATVRDLPSGRTGIASASVRVE